MESQSLAASWLKRNAAVPKHAQTAINELKGFRLKHKQIENTQKRKVFADDHDTVSQIEDKGSLKRQHLDAEALVGQYESCETDAERMKWLVAAILARNGEDHHDSGLTIEELEEQWFDPQAAEEPGPNQHPGIAVGPILHTLDGVDNNGTQSTYNSMPRALMPTDSMTIGVGPAIYCHLQGPDGKHNKVEGYAVDNDGTWPKDPPLKNAHLDTTAHMGTPSHINMPLKISKLKATNSTTIGVGQPRVYHDLWGSDGKHKEIEGYTAYTHSSSQTPQGYLKRRAQQVQEHVPIDGLDMQVTPVPQPQSWNNGRLQIVCPQQLPTPASSQQGNASLSHSNPAKSITSSPSHLTNSAVPHQHAPLSVAPTAKVVQCPAAPPLVALHSVTSCSTASHPTTPRAVLCHTLPHPVEPHPVMPCPVMPCPVKPHPVVPCPVAPHPVAPVAPWLVAPCPVEPHPHAEPRPAAPHATEQAAKPLTKKQMAQLQWFGLAKQLVKLLAERVKVCAVIKCAYANVLPPDTVLPKLELENKKLSTQQKVPLAPAWPGVIAQPAATINIEVLSDKWVINEWVTVNNLLRPGVPMLELKQEYAQYVRKDFPGIHNYVKTTITGLVHQAYNFKRSYSDMNKELVKSLLDNAFHLHTLQQPDKYQFHHDIIPDTI